MKQKPEIDALNLCVEEFDKITGGSFDRETNPKTLVLFAGAFSPRGSDLPARLSKAFREVEKAAN